MPTIRYILVNKKKTRLYTGQNNLIICKFDKSCNELPVCEPLRCSALEFLTVKPKMKQIIELLNNSKNAILGVKKLSIEVLDYIIGHLSKQAQK